VFIDPTLFFKCLADQTRLRCLLLLQQQGELCVCELIEALQESQPKISRHLAQLKKCGLLSDRKQGQWVFYRISESLPIWSLQILNTTSLSNTAFLQQNLKNLSNMRNRPERDLACY